jgi:hypothetical protein
MQGQKSFEINDMILRREITKELLVTTVAIYIPSTEIIIALCKWLDLPVLPCFLSTSLAALPGHKKHNKLCCAQRHDVSESTVLGEMYYTVR